MRFVQSLCLLMTLLSLVGCKSSPSPLPADPCEWSRPILFSADTKTWLLRDGPLPEPVKADLWKIVQYNETVAAVCGKSGR